MTEAAHPSLDEIAAYHAGSLRPSEETRLQDHFVACRRCADLLLERDELAQLVDEAEAAPAPEVAADWEALRARLPQDRTPDLEERRPGRTAAPLPARRRRSSPFWLPALAASLLVATLGLAAWNVSLQRRLAEVSGPQVNAPIEELAPAARGAAGDTVLDLAPGARLYTLVLRPAEAPIGGGWAVEIARPDGGVVWRGEGLEPNEFGSFSLTLPRGLVGEGDYRIHLRGPGADGREVREDYRLRIVARK